MEPIKTIRLLRELIQRQAWSAVAGQMDLLHVDAVAYAMTGLDRALLKEAFARLPYQRRSAVFAHLDASAQQAVLNAVGPDKARRIIRGLLPEHRRALLKSVSLPYGRAVPGRVATVPGSRPV